MTGEEIKALRRKLDITARQLGERLGVDQKTVLAWEREEIFPTKKHVEAMHAQTADGAVTSPKPGVHSVPSIWNDLSNPAVWKLFRKILAHDELREKVTQLAENYEDPAS
ncbi:MAG: helix-turn-helix domain-containing protein [Polyangiaceae bacterium]|nr:helix-turn-helix domain-containing protein [Polyangiaceae bacterium]